VWLLDTNVVSELRKPAPSRAVVNWVRSVPADSLFISVMTVGEVQRGIEKLRERDAARAADLETWLEQIVQSHMILELDTASLRLWGRLTHRQDDSVLEDALIAATALTRDLCVVTRNVKDFARWPVRLMNPFDSH
jgi:predicted nucleic acid-binding protein